MTFKEFINRQPKGTPKYISIEELREVSRNEFRKKFGRDPVDNDELRAWCAQELYKQPR